jgi:hypothetical protein
MYKTRKASRRAVELNDYGGGITIDSPAPSPPSQPPSFVATGRVDNGATSVTATVNSQSGTMTWPLGGDATRWSCAFQNLTPGDQQVLQACAVFRTRSPGVPSASNPSVSVCTHQRIDIS